MLLASCEVRKSTQIICYLDSKRTILMYTFPVFFFLFFSVIVFFGSLCSPLIVFILL